MNIEKILLEKGAKKLGNSGNRVAIYLPKNIEEVVINKCSNFLEDVFDNCFEQVGEVKTFGVCKPMETADKKQVYAYCNDKQLETAIDKVVEFVKSLDRSGVYLEVNDKLFVIE